MPVPDWSMIGMTITAGKLIGNLKINLYSIESFLDPDKLVVMAVYSPLYVLCEV